MPDETKRQPAFTDPVPVVVTASPTADTRTCDVAIVTEAELGRSSRLHIEDVRAMLIDLAGPEGA